MPHYRIEYIEKGVATSHRLHAIETDEDAVRLYHQFRKKKEAEGDVLMGGLIFVEEEEVTRSVSVA